jgi:putative ABC transport system permease protein
VPEDFYQEIRKIKGIGGIDTYRNLLINYQGKPVRLSSVNVSVLQKFTRFNWFKGGNENWDQVKQGEVAVSESFYLRFGKKTGDTIVLNGIEGAVELKIAAVFYDYTTEHGLITMDRSTYLKIYGDHTIDSLAIYLDQDADRRQEILDEVKRKANAWNLPTSSREELHTGVLSIFDTTFAVTRSMRFLAVIVAFFGIAGAILTLFLERQREFGIYRALGFSTPQVAAMTMMEGLGMGLISFVLCIAVGSVLALVLIKVINFHSFNWTIFYYPAVKPYLLAFATSLLASLGACVYPVVRICRTYPHMQIREE